MDSSEFKLEATAYHEAGHAFMHLLFGHDVTRIFIDEDDGKVESNYSVEPATLQEPLEKYIFACIAIAGSVAEGKFMKLDDPRKKFGDGQSIYDFFEVGKLQLSKEVQSLLKDATNQIVMDNWSHISVFAKSLYAQRGLSKIEIDQLSSDIDFEEKRDFYIKKLGELDFAAESKTNNIE